jgi:hypothetical protein
VKGVRAAAFIRFNGFPFAGVSRLNPDFAMAYKFRCGRDVLLGKRQVFWQVGFVNKKVRAGSALAWSFTDKQFTPWGGLRIFEEMLRRLGWAEALARAPLPAVGSNRGIDPVLMVQGFLVTIWTGGARFAHTAAVRFDDALRGIFGLAQVASVSTFTRFFRRFDRKENDAVFGQLSRWLWQQVGGGAWTVDLDSSVLTRYGEQEGCEVGYNPRHRGQQSHHPLMAFAAESRMIISAWLRPGNTTDSSNAENFLREVLAVLGQRHRIGLLRCDSGFCIGKFLDLVEASNIHYIVPARLLKTVKRQVAGLKDWMEIGAGVGVAEFTYQAQGWSKGRRVVVVRQRTEDRSKARQLLEVPGYSYSVFVTNLTLSALQVRALYQGRADSENRIKELLQDFAISGFVSQKFWATEAAFRLACCAYNLMALFRQALLGAAAKHTLATLRAQCFAIGASLGKAGRQRMLRVGLPPPRRAWFRNLFAAAQQIPIPLPIKNTHC